MPDRSCGWIVVLTRCHPIVSVPVQPIGQGVYFWLRSYAKYFIMPNQHLCFLVCQPRFSDARNRRDGRQCVVLIGFSQQLFCCWKFANIQAFISQHEKTAIFHGLKIWYKSLSYCILQHQKRHTDQQINLNCSANQFVFLSKSICFPQQINLLCRAMWLSNGSSIKDKEHKTHRALHSSECFILDID